MFGARLLGRHAEQVDDEAVFAVLHHVARVAVRFDDLG